MLIARRSWGRDPRVTLAALAHPVLPFAAALRLVDLDIALTLCLVGTEGQR